MLSVVCVWGCVCVCAVCCVCVCCVCVVHRSLSLPPWPQEAAWSGKELNAEQTSKVLSLPLLKEELRLMLYDMEEGLEEEAGYVEEAPESPPSAASATSAKGSTPRPKLASGGPSGRTPKAFALPPSVRQFHERASGGVGGRGTKPVGANGRTSGGERLSVWLIFIYIDLYIDLYRCVSILLPIYIDPYKDLDILNYTDAISVGFDPKIHLKKIGEKTFIYIYV